MRRMKSKDPRDKTLVIGIEGDDAGKVARLAERLAREAESGKEPQPEELGELLQELAEIVTCTEEEAEAGKRRHRRPHRHGCTCGKGETYAEAGSCVCSHDGAKVSAPGGVRQIVELLAECFGRKLSPSLMAVYEDILSGVDPKALEKAARKCMAAPRGGMPSPGRLLHDAGAMENLENLSMQELRKRILFACTKDGWDDGTLIEELESRIARGERWPD